MTHISSHILISDNWEVICFADHPDQLDTAALAQPVVWVWGWDYQLDRENLLETIGDANH